MLELKVTSRCLGAVEPASSVAVVDIGSNSIKILVARRDATGALEALKIKTIDARISAGISQAVPRLSEEGMARGVAAVAELLKDAAAFKPERVILVATSAVRDAANGDDFIARVRNATGHSIRLLTGDEEASLIGRGLTCDPAVGALRDFYVFDLGGGSLECLSFRNRVIQQAISLRLGCVRLTERYVPDTAKAFSAESQRSVMELVKEVVIKSGFHFDLPAGAVAIGTGGTVTTARIVLGASEGKALEQVPATIGLAQLRELLRRTGGVDLAARREIPGMPPARADVFPTALATFLALADIGGFDSLLNSLYNLRWGLAAEALGPVS